MGDQEHCEACACLFTTPGIREHVVEVANEMDHLGCSGGRSMWQIIGYWLGWSGSPGKGRAVGENGFSGDIKPDIKRVRYEVSMRQVRRGRLAVAIANGRVLSDDTCVYVARDMRVGLIAS